MLDNLTLEELGQIHLEVNEENYVHAAADPIDVKYRLEHDYEFFINFFLYEELTLAVPKIHKECWELMTKPINNDKVAIAIPRGYAKTTLAKLAVIWYFLFTDVRFIAYLSSTGPIAIEACRDIYHFLTENENFIKIFGKLEFSVEREGDGFYQFHIGNKRCILRALGARQQIRGLNVDNMRPQVAIIDDLEDLNNIATPLLKKQLSNWLYRTFFRAMARRNKIIWIGNIIQSECILENIITEENDWRGILYGSILKDNTALWEDLYTVEDLIKMFVDYRSAGEAAGWFAEMMNAPIPEGLGLIKQHEIRYSEPLEPQDYIATFITIDPSVSFETSADDTAITVHGVRPRKVDVVAYVQEKLDPLQTINLTLDLAHHWGCTVIGVEGTAYQASLQFWFNIEITRRQLFRIQVIKLLSHKTKTQRLKIWASMIKVGITSLPNWDMDMTRQLLIYDPTKRHNKDDLIDAAAQSVPMVQNYMHMIMTKPNEGYVTNVGVISEMERCAI